MKKLRGGHAAGKAGACYPVAPHRPLGEAIPHGQNPWVSIWRETPWVICRRGAHGGAHGEGVEGLAWGRGTSDAPAMGPDQTHGEPMEGTCGGVLPRLLGDLGSDAAHTSTMTHRRKAFENRKTRGVCFLVSNWARVGSLVGGRGGGAAGLAFRTAGYSVLPPS